MKRSRRSVLATIAVTTTGGCLRLQEGAGSESTPTRNTVGGDTNGAGADDASDGTGSESGGGESQTDEPGGSAALYAFDAKTGEREWLHETTPNGWETQVDFVTSGNGLVYYTADSTGSGDNQQPVVRALDPGSGNVQWKNELPDGFFSGITVYEDELYVSMVNRTVVLGASNGDRLREMGYVSGFDGFRRVEDTLYFLNNESVAVDLATGNERWRQTLDREPNNRPIFRDGSLYYGTEAGYVVALDAADGTSTWESRVDGSIRHNFAVSRNHVWIVDESAILYGLDRSSGDEVYRREKAIQARQPVAIGDLLFVYEEDGQETIYEVGGGGTVTLTEQWSPETNVHFATDETFVGGWDQVQTFDTSGNVGWESGPIEETHYLSGTEFSTVLGDDYVFVGTTWTDR